MNTRNAILETLRRQQLTIAELCEILGVTRNAIQVQIKQLEAEGLIRVYKTGKLGGGKVGKPAVTYEAAPGSEDINSQGYRVLLAEMLSTFKNQFGAENTQDFLEQVGRNMAKGANLGNPASFEDGLAKAMAVADSIGANTEAVPQEGGVMVRNYSCPLANSVRAESCVCKAVAAFFAEATNCNVTEQCVRADRLICQYWIETTDNRSE